MPLGPSDITIASTGANQGAMRVISRRVEEHVARAMLRDLWGEGLIVVRADDWDIAIGLVRAVKRTTTTATEE